MIFFIRSFGLAMTLSSFKDGSCRNIPNASGRTVGSLGSVLLSREGKS